MVADSHPAAQPEGIAIVGIALRFPGARSVEEFWRNLCGGVESITFFPETEAAGRGAARAAALVRAGAVLDDIETFDAAFFGLSPAEAELTDPQHRLFLECAWEALESAGCNPASGESCVGVFAGASLSSYLLFNLSPSLGFRGAVNDLPKLIGNDKDYLATRVSYALDLRGPSVSIQTACSTSLVAVHLACQSLLNGECDVALAGGVTVRVPQRAGYIYQEGGYLSPDGHCRAFDAAARGTVFGNGAGVVVLKRLSDALADGDNIDAVIRGSAVNNDGSAKIGYTAPSSEGQARVIAEAQAVAGVTPDTITYVEAHGTGTPLGDPIEVSALAQVFRAVTNERGFCALGSVKTNVGHLESAAGVAGLIKAALALRHRLLPPSLHFSQPNPHIDFDHSPFYVNTKLTRWAEGRTPRRAGVSSFGIGGTNAHVVLEEAPSAECARPPHGDSASRPLLLPLSARSRPALRALAGAYEQFLRDAEASPEDICYTAGARRAHHQHRVAFVGRTCGELGERVADWLGSGAVEAEVAEGGGRRPRVAFVYSGQGAQWWAMGRQLWADEPAFRHALRRCHALVARASRWPLLDELLADRARSRLDGDDVGLTQVALFSLQVALTELWRSWGVEPDAVVGHSMGEVAAAYACGALSLEQAVGVICARGRLLQSATRQGAMAAVAVGLDEARALIAGHEGRVGIGASNGPHSTVLSGEAAAVEEVLRRLEEREVFVQRLRTTGVAGHSPQLEPLCAELSKALDGLKPGRARVRMISSVTAQAVAGPELDGPYWARNLRETVMFHQAMVALAREGYAAYLEVGAHPVLAGAVEECLRAEACGGQVLASLRRQEDERAEMLRTLGVLYGLGCPVDWKRLAGDGRRCVRLPAYPWQRLRCWVDPPKGSEVESGRPCRAQPAESGRDPLLGTHLSSSLHPGTHFWENEWSLERFPGWRDHAVGEAVVLPAAAYAEMALAAAYELFGEQPHGLEEVSFQNALVLPAVGGCVIQVALFTSEAGDVSFRVSSRPAHARAPDAEWLPHAAGTVVRGQADGPRETPTRVSPEDLKRRCRESVVGPEYYRALSERGLTYGPSFRGVERLWSNHTEALALLSNLPDLEPCGESHRLHPSLLDNCFQTLAALLPGGDGTREASGAYLPVGLKALRLRGPVPARPWAHAVLRPPAPDADTLAGDVYLRDDDGRVMIEVVGLQARRLEPAGSRREPGESCGLFYEINWVPLPPPPPPPRGGTWLVFADEHGAGEALATRLEQGGCRVVLAGHGGRYEAAGPCHYRVNPSRPEDFRRLLREAFDESDEVCHGVAHLWSLDAGRAGEMRLESLDAARALGCVSVLHLVQALARSGWAEPPRLCLVTNGVHTVGDLACGVSVAQSPAWGLGKALAYEHPELRCKLIDLSPEGPLEELAALAAEVGAEGPETEVALRGRARYGARLCRLAAGPASPQTASRMAAFSADATYLIAGGLGGLGLAVAGWMVKRGARHLVLAGRAEPSPPAASAVEALRGSGAEVFVARADVALPGQLAALLAESARRFPPLRGVVHAAGVVADATLLNLNEEQFERVWRPKVDGAWNLYTLTRDMPLDFFVLFSSVASVVGSPGQANHSAANAFLDALARHGRAEGRPCLSVNWGPWGEVGRAAGAERAESFAARGLASISRAQGLEALGVLLRSGHAQVAAMNFHPERWRQFHPQVTSAGFFSRLDEREAGGRRPPERGGIRERLLASKSVWGRRSLLESHLQEQVAAVLRLSASDVALDKPLRELGLDSLRTLELRNRLESALQLTLPATLVWKYPTAAELGEHLAGLMGIGPE